MRLCSICDKKIEGTWCKNCHRRVKTYELPEGIRFNEQHDPKNDVGCTYHADEKQQETESETTFTTRTTYTGAGTSAGRTSTGTTTGKANGKKNVKIVAVIIIIYALITVFSVAGPIVAGIIGALSEEFDMFSQEEYKNEDLFTKDPEQIISEDETDRADYEAKIAAIEQLKPVEEVAGDGYVMRYYNPEDIATLGFACDEVHFDVTVPEFEEWLTENWVESYASEDEVSEYYNSYYEDEYYTWLYFSAFRDYYASDDFAVRIGYDTVTQQVHMIGFVATMDHDATSLYYKTLKEFDPETEWTQDLLAENIKEAVEAEEYTTFYTSDAVEIDAQVREGYYSVTFYPVYE